MILSHRIPFPRYADDDQFKQTLEFLQRYRNVVDEICLFSENTNFACWPLESFAKNADIMQCRMHALRQAGFHPVGINALNTLGHLDDVADYYPPMPFPPMVGHDGSQAKTCPCPNAPALHTYLREKYRIIAAAQPDFLWVDDDFRLQAHGVAFPCFCTVCLEQFGHQYPQRADLVAALNSPEHGHLREQWIEHNIRTLETLARLITQVIHQVNPDIEIGLMTAGPGWTSYSGLAFTRLFAIFGGKRARPGGGMYTDYTPHEMSAKIFDIGRQCEIYPPQVSNIQYEVENFPCQALDKSPRTVLNESLLALGAGCNGVAFSAFRYIPHPLADYHPLFQALLKERPLWDTFVAQAEGLPLRGYWPVWSSELMAKRQVDNGNWFWNSDEYNIDAPLPLTDIGLPFTLNADSACGSVLSGKLIEVLRDEQLQQILSGGVLMDVAALHSLWDRGFGELTGVKPGRHYSNGVRELFSDHPLNGIFAGDGRSVSMAYYPSVAHELLPIAEGVETLSTLLRFDEVAAGACVTAYQNELGGRVVVSGYLPWKYNTTWGKRAQVTALADWAARGRLPLIIDPPAPVRITPLVRMSADSSRFAAILLNTGYDPTGPLIFRFRAAATDATLLTPDAEIPLRSQQQPGELSVTLSNLPPWQAQVIVGRSR